MIEYLKQIRDLIFKQNEFRILSINYQNQTKKIKTLISQISTTNVLEQKISRREEKI